MIRGNDVMQAVQASAEASGRDGYDEAIAELGADPGQLREACRRHAVEWLRRLPVNGTLADLEALIAAAEVEGVVAGIRLGRLYPTPERGAA